MEPSWACITWTNEFPKGVEAVCVSYFFFFHHTHTVVMVLMTSWILIGADCCCWCGISVVDAYELFIHGSCLTHNLQCVRSAATNEGFYSRHSAQCVLSPRCECAVAMQGHADTA